MELKESEIAKKGRAYLCLGCEKFVHEKRYVESHYYKYHLALQEVPYYCSLCHFITTEKIKLHAHQKTYTRHTDALHSLEKNGISPELSDVYLHHNPNGIIVGDEHVKQLDREPSREIWTARALIKLNLKTKAEAEREISQLISTIVRKLSTEGNKSSTPLPPPTLPEPLREKPLSSTHLSLPEISLPVLSNDVNARPVDHHPISVITGSEQSEGALLDLANVEDIWEEIFGAEDLDFMGSLDTEPSGSGSSITSDNLNSLASSDSGLFPGRTSITPDKLQSKLKPEASLPKQTQVQDNTGSQKALDLIASTLQAIQDDLKHHFRLANYTLQNIHQKMKKQTDLMKHPRGDNYREYSQHREQGHKRSRNDSPVSSGPRRKQLQLQRK